MKTIGEALRGFLERRGAPERMRLVRLWENWDMVMGTDIAVLAYPLGHRKRILLVGAEDNMAMQDLTFLTPEILERVNAFMDDVSDGPYFERVEVHLLQRRTPLDEVRVERSAPPPRVPPRPDNLGGLLGAFDPESPVGRAYASYVRMFREIGDAATKPGGAAGHNGRAGQTGQSGPPGRDGPVRTGDRK
ncbi:DUF721 domain-containing protein [Nitratidesulfovibrio liaohensis]|uniref:DUF721 domain-containing protein n=1 Tax=Nitratidesulfovibrio liaohensis TaxID=2604158 RepID=UPI003132D27E